MRQDLQFFQLVLDTLPDDDILDALETRRGRGRDDDPVAAMWRGHRLPACVRTIAAKGVAV